jgi:uncharacterized membrane protein
MKYLFAIACSFFGIGLIGIGAQQFQYADIRPVIIPAWPLWLHNGAVAYITGTLLIVTGILILIGKKTVIASVVTACFLFVCFLFLQCIYQLFICEYSPKHLALWTNALKELTLCGGCLVVAGTFLSYTKSSFIIDADKLVFTGRVFYSVMMIAFGLDHFYYADFVSTLVPAWLPWHLFWCYAAGILLIASGIAVMFKIYIQPVAMLQSIMLFLWVILLHIPRAVAQPITDQGNEITSVFEALAFSGISLAIYLHYSLKNAGKSMYSLS